MSSEKIFFCVRMCYLSKKKNFLKPPTILVERQKQTMSRANWLQISLPDRRILFWLLAAVFFKWFGWLPSKTHVIMLWSCLRLSCKNKQPFEGFGKHGYSSTRVRSKNIMSKCNDNHYFRELIVELNCCTAGFAVKKEQLKPIKQWRNARRHLKEHNNMAQTTKIFYVIM